MAGLSLYPDPTPPGRAGGGGPLPAAAQPPPSSAAALEATLRSLFDQATSPSSPSTCGGAGGGSMSGGMGIKLVPGPSPTLISVEFSDQLSERIRELSGSEKAEVEVLVCRLLNERVARARAAGGGSVPEMLAWVRSVATSPGDPATAGLQARWKWADQVMRARAAMFMTPGQVAEAAADELPYNNSKAGTRRKYRNGTSSVPADSSFEIPERFGKRHCSGSQLNYNCSNQPKRRSGRFLGMLKLGDNYLPRKRVPVGPFFQADVPEWTGPPERKRASDNGKYAADSKWLGTMLWPLQGSEKGSLPETVGEGKDRMGAADVCTCYNPRSLECNRHHIRMRRFRLRSELGQAFLSMGFDTMGEDVSSSWSREEQLRFDTLVKSNPISEGATFWYDALNSFPRRNWRDIASYYFNVYVLKRMSFQTRLACKTIDSDDDEWNAQPNGNSSGSLRRL